MQRYIEDGVAAGNAMLVAIGDDRVIGWCDIRRLVRDVYAHRGVVFMGVAHPWRGRGRGVGRTLLRTALQHALAQGLKRIELEVRADHVTAIHLYTAAGFVEEGDMTDALRVDGASVTLKRMALLF